MLSLNFMSDAANDRRKRTAKAHESGVAKGFGGIKTAASGSLGMKADVWAGNRDAGQRLMVECKATETNTLVVKVDWLEKLLKEAREMHREPVLAIRCRNAGVEYDFGLVPLDRWGELVQWEHQFPTPDASVTTRQFRVNYQFLDGVPDRDVPFTLHFSQVRVVHRRAWVALRLAYLQELYAEEATRLLASR